MIIADVDMSLFNRGVAGLIQKAKLNSRDVVEKESGELMKTLVRTSPPRDPKKTREAIRTTILGRFEMVDMNPHPKYTGKVGQSGILWYFADKDFLRGIAPDKDMRDASVKELARIRHQITPQGRLKLPFKHPRRNQKVLLYQNIVVKQAILKKLITQEQRKVGRLKAGWLVAVGKGVIRLSGGNQPPQWVQRHVMGARGDFQNGLSNTEFPSFTIINRAKGIGKRSVRAIVQMAVNIRGKAMAKNALFFAKGKKQLSDYAR
jgi:hypothetical protein